MNEVYFCHPGEENEIKEKILADIKTAKKRILCAMAFFTDEEISEALLEKDVIDKRIILNNADFYREESDVAKKIFFSLDCIRLGTYYNSNKKPSHMHNKILICDNTVWIGSYNFTYSASMSNWENMLRIDQDDIVEKVVYEFETMWLYAKIIKEKLQGARCLECGKIVNDAIKHYAVFINTASIINGYFEPEAIMTLCIEKNDREERYEKCAQCGRMVLSSQIIIIDDSSSFEGVCRKCAINDVKFWSKHFEDEEEI